MRRPQPWREADVLLTVLLVGTGALLALTGWWGTSGTAAVTRQRPWVTLALAGAVTGCLGAAYLLVAGRVALRRRHGRLATRLAALQPATLDAPTDDALVSGPGMTRFHWPWCPATAGKRVIPATRRAHLDAGRRPCDLCEPGPSTRRGPA